MNKSVITLLAAIALLGLFISGCVKTPLMLEITSPEDGALLETNIIIVTGTVSDAEASVIVNGADAWVEKDGTFIATIQLTEGDNRIEAVAKRGEEEISRNVVVSFAPALVVFLHAPIAEAGVNYIEKPIDITGSVNYPIATVTVNSVHAIVAKDGSFQAQIQLEEAFNPSKTVEVVATLDDGSSDSDTISYFLTVEGGLVFPPGQGVASGIRVTSINNMESLELEAGESALFELRLEVGKGINRPMEFKWLFAGISIPEGLAVVIQPSAFTIYPNSTYQLALIIETTSKLASGEYILAMEGYLEDYHMTTVAIEVNVL